MKEIVYVAELDQDVDDMIAALYLHNKNVLKCVVLDPMLKTKEGFQRKKYLEDLGIEVRKNFPSITKYVFVGGALTNLSTYLLTHKVDLLVMNGGFVGSNIMEKPLKKFEGKTTIRTFNFNIDVNATDKVLKSKNIEKVILIGKNVCHNKKNTKLGIWKNENILNEYEVSDTKLQHDMLACREGLIYLNLLNEESYLNFINVKPFNEGLNGNMTKWGSSLDLEINKYNIVLAARDWKI